jgi:hypothetical protein
MKRILVMTVVMMLAAAANAEESGRPKPKPQPKATPLSKADQQIMDVQTAKARFMAAVGSCTRPDTCDPKASSRNQELTTLLKQAEDAFLEACIQCASDKACEGERLKIRDGKGRYGYNVCVATKTTSGSKSAKPATTGSKPGGAAPAPKPSSSSNPAGASK